MDICKKNVAGLSYCANFILNVKCHLKIVAPISALMTIVRENRILKKYFESIKIGADTIKHDNVWGNYQKIARQLRIVLIKLVIVAPCQNQTQYFCFTATGCHFHDISRPSLAKHTCLNHPLTIKLHH